MQVKQLVDTQGPAEEEAPPAGPATSWDSAGEELTHLICDELRWRYGRHHQRLIDALRIQVAGDVTLLICVTVGDVDIVQNEMIGAIHCILVRLGAPPQLVFTTRAGWEAGRRDAGNARSRPPSIQGLPATV